MPPAVSPERSGSKSRGFRQRRYWPTGLAAALLYGAACLAGAAVNGADIPKVAFFGFQLINTSLAPTTPDERRRIAMLEEMFQEQLDYSGRFNIVPIPPGLQRQIAAGPEISGCNGCEREFAKKAGGDWAAWGTVQKVSDLILNINLYMENAGTGKLEFAKSVDIRSNTDESWRRGLDYLLHNYLILLKKSSLGTLTPNSRNKLIARASMLNHSYVEMPNEDIILPVKHTGRLFQRYHLLAQ